MREMHPGFWPETATGFSAAEESSADEERCVTLNLNILMKIPFVLEMRHKCQSH
jgi:hypothetical protein